MTHQEAQELVEFDEFARLVGLPAIHVRTALRALHLIPVPLVTDARQKRYKREWVSPVKEWIEKTLGSQ
jgi:hypothetical protein